MRRLARMLAVMALALLASAAGAVGGQLYFYHTDPAGTPIAMSDASGNVVWRADYRPFGEVQSESGTAPNDKLFVGKEKDDETGLYYFGARYMDDRVGRFISTDPVGPVDPRTGKVNEKLLLNPQRLNSYAYALNNPYRYIDPDGNTVWDIADFVFFGYSVYEFASEPSWSGAGDVALNGLGLLPVIPALGTIKTGLKAAEKGMSKIDDVVSAGKGCGSVADLMKDAVKIKRGKADQYRKPGDFDTANRDFDKLVGESSIMDHGEGIRSSTLPDGGTVSVRPKSDQGAPTIQINPPTGRPIKVRYE